MSLDQSSGQERTVTWTAMADGTQADDEMLTPRFEEHVRGGLVENLVQLLGLLKGPKLG